MNLLHNNQLGNKALRYTASQECLSFLKKKIYELWQSQPTSEFGFISAISFSTGTAKVTQLYSRGIFGKTSLYLMRICLGYQYSFWTQIKVLLSMLTISMKKKYPASSTSSHSIWWGLQKKIKILWNSHRWKIGALLHLYRFEVYNKHLWMPTVHHAITPSIVQLQFCLLRPHLL